MTEQPLLSNGQLVGWGLSIATILGGVISVLFWRYIAALEKRLEDCEAGRVREVDAANKEKDRAWAQFAELQRLISSEAEKDRIMLREMNASWQATLDPPRSRR